MHSPKDDNETGFFFPEAKPGANKTQLIRDVLKKTPEVSRQKLAMFYKVHISTVHRAAASLNKSGRKTKGKDSKSKLVRYLVLHNLHADNDALISIWSELNANNPLKKQEIYLAKNQIRKRYGNDPIPEHNGKLNLSAMVERAMRIKPNLSNKKIIEYCALDGLEVKPELVRGVRSKMKDSPDPNQHTGPRAGAGKSKRISGRSLIDNELDTDGYLAIERDLEEIISRVRAMGDDRLVDILLRGRRIASSHLID